MVPAPGGAQIPLGQIADIQILTGPPVIKDENGSLTGWVYVDVAGRDIGSYVEEAKERVNRQLELPTGYALVWAGQYELMQRVSEKLRYIIPITLLIIVVMLYLNFKSIIKTGIVLLSVPFALTGSIWYLYLLGYNMSIAVWVGMIALAGVAAETGVVMLVYLDEAFERYKKQGKMKTQNDLIQAACEGSVLRLRPKLMTVLTTILGLLPIMLMGGAGSDVTRRIAAPMIGGLVSSTALTLIVIHAIYVMWKWNFELNRQRKSVA